jgi:hypothetical protein
MAGLFSTWQNSKTIASLLLVWLESKRIRLTRGLHCQISTLSHIDFRFGFLLFKDQALSETVLTSGVLFWVLDLLLLVKQCLLTLTEENYLVVSMCLS